MSVSAFLLYALIALLSYLFWLAKSHFSYWHKRGIPCEKPNLMLGNITGIQTERSFTQIFLDYYRKFSGTGPFAGFYWFQRISVFVLDTELAKNILIKDFNKFTDHGFYSNERDDPLSGQLFLLDGQRWRNMRNKLSPAFSSGKMKFMFPTVVKVGHDFVEVFGETVKSGAIVEVRDLLARFTTDVIGTCAFGIECSSLKDPNVEFRYMGKEALLEKQIGVFTAFMINSFPKLARVLRFKVTADNVSEFFLRIVRETVALREQNNIRRNDFMDMLIDLKNKKLIKSEHGDELTNLTLEEIAAQAFVFFFAGFETSSTTMGFALYELARHEEIQARAREEVQKVLKEHNNEFTYECMRELAYLEQIISETLRLYTVLPILNRYCLEDYAVPGHPNYVIKKGMGVLIPAGAIHRDERYYPNPDIFNPDNFTPEKVKERDSVEWLPFGDGPRNCIGMRFGLMQARIGLALLLKNFKFSVCSETQIPLKISKKTFLMTPESGVYLKVEKA